VEAQANIPSAWGNAVRVRRAKNKPLSLPADLAARAVFLAKLHREKNVESWLARIVKERVELEERAFTQAECVLSARVALGEKRLWAFENFRLNGWNGCNLIYTPNR
jgi:hypothetical protein